jgi:predicted nucleic acid-binding protein
MEGDAPVLIFLDTDVLIEILNKKSIRGQEIYEKLEKNGGNFGITSITLYETLHFFMKMKMKTPPIHLLQVYGFSRQDAQKAAELEIELEKRRVKAKATVLIISSIVMNKGASLCSLNENFNELKSVGLKLFMA